MKDFLAIAAQFRTAAPVTAIAPLGAGNINDTFLATTEGTMPDYVLQRINDAIFTDVDMLQDNIFRVCAHLRGKLAARGVADLDRAVLTPVPTLNGATYVRDAEGRPWRMTRLIPRSCTFDTADPHYAEMCGRAFGDFQAMLTDLNPLPGETIPRFHDMELRMEQLRDACASDPVGRLREVAPMVAAIEADANEMCRLQRLGREGKMPLRVVHCDTKVNNMLFDKADGHFLCVIDLDTVMPGFITSDTGDFLRTGASTVAEDCPELDRIAFRMDVYEAFMRGYTAAATFLTPTERGQLAFSGALFPYMQCVRFLADYINGDTYYKTKYPEHNLVRARNQWCLYQCACDNMAAMERAVL